MSDGTQPSTGTLSATLTSIDNVCALRADIPGGTAVVGEHSATVSVQRCTVSQNDRVQVI